MKTNSLNQWHARKVAEERAVGAETKCTPGPWKATIFPNPLRESAYWPLCVETNVGGTGEEYGERIAILTDRWDEEWQANARLMAAAPDLLAALEYWRSIAGQFADTAEVDCVIGLTEAAIDKATKGE